MRTFSRRQNIEAKENKRRAWGFVLLSIAVIAFMFYFGLPLLVRVSNFAYDLRGSAEPVANGDTTPPPPPRIDNLPEYTNSEKIEVKGSSEAGARISIYLNGSKDEVLVNNEGRFSKEVSLSDGVNTIYGIAKDSEGNVSRESTTYTIVLDKKAPDLEILTPKSGDVFSGSRQRQIRIEGTTEKDSRVQVNGHLSIVDSSGKFVYPTNLEEGENKFVIKSEDSAGNFTEKEISVSYYP